MENNTKHQKPGISKIFDLLIPFLFIGLGILMLINPALMQKIFLVICLLILEGCIIELVIYFAVRPYEKKPKHLYAGLAMGIGGTGMILVYYAIDWLIPFCIGLALCADGLLGIRKAFQLKAAHYPWQASLAMETLIFCMGIAVLICTFFTNWIWMITGILMIISGLLCLIHTLLIANTGAHPSSNYIDVTSCQVDIRQEDE